MNRKDDTVELGTASIATQGPGKLPGDDFIGRVAAGLSDD